MGNKEYKHDEVRHDSAAGNSYRGPAGGPHRGPRGPHGGPGGPGSGEKAKDLVGTWKNCWGIAENIW